MAKYEVLQRSFIGNRIVEAGDIVEFDGDAGPNLKPVKKGETTAPAVPVVDFTGAKVEATNKPADDSTLVPESDAAGLV